MDPVSIVGLLSSIVQLIDIIATTIGYLNKVRDASKDCAMLAQKGTDLLALLIIIASPFTYTNPTTASEYDTATISSVVFGIFMAPLTLYMIWQNGVQCIGAYDNPEVS
jgi:hypothetical protein